MKNDEQVSLYRSAVGPLELRVSDRGVRSLSFAGDSFSAPEALDHPIMEKLVAELNRYFSGDLKTFSVPLDLTQGTAFERAVWQELLRIPYGETRSYAEVAAAMGQPTAARAVGSANGKNCIPILIPCHRVIKADGRLGGYGSGVHVKKALLELEGLAVDEDLRLGTGR